MLGALKKFFGQMFGSFERNKEVKENDGWDPKIYEVGPGSKSSDQKEGGTKYWDSKLYDVGPEHSTVDDDRPLKFGKRQDEHSGLEQSTVDGDQTFVFKEGYAIPMADPISTRRDRTTNTVTARQGGIDYAIPEETPKAPPRIKEPDPIYEQPVSLAIQEARREVKEAVKQSKGSDGTRAKEESSRNILLQKSDGFSR